MKRFQIYTISALATGLVLGMVACSGGGFPQNPGTQCPDAYAPASQTAANKVSLKSNPDGTINLKPGKYLYNHAELYYVDDLYAPMNNYRVHIADALQKDGTTFGGATLCQRNVRAGMGALNLDVNALGISSLDIDKNGKPAPPSVKTLGFKILPAGQLQVNVAPAPNEKPADPGSLYPDPTSFAFIHPEAPNLIEIRSTGVVRNAQGVKTGTWYLAVFFWRTDLPKP